jgi:hypothetical protein
MYAETTEKEKENATNFFFLFALEVLNSTFFFTERKSKKSGKNRRVVFNSSNTILSLSVVCVCVFVFLTPSLFFLYIYAHLASANIHQCEKDRKEGKKNIYRMPKTNGKHTNSFMLSQY